MKARRHRLYGEAQALNMPRRAWEEITFDFITNLPPRKLNSEVVDAILIIVDRYTKMNVFVPTTKRRDSVELAKLLMDVVVRRYGVPRGILSDRGSLFTSQYWSDFAYEARVKHKLSTAFHPQTDGQTERMNQTLE
jgi:transposase InsO family protein